LQIALCTAEIPDLQYLNPNTDNVIVQGAPHTKDIAESQDASLNECKPLKCAVPESNPLCTWFLEVIPYVRGSWK